MDWDEEEEGAQALGERWVSIPQSEFDGLGHTTSAPPPTPPSRFQFPSRNSMDWDDFPSQGTHTFLDSFNSPVGIRWIGTWCLLLPRLCPRAVSIPQSEFDGLGRTPARRESSGEEGFNSPVGIRWIGTPTPLAEPSPTLLFQFPSRNSMDWDISPYLARPRNICVSIPQSEFDGLGLGANVDFPDRVVSVSIPQSEFDGLGRPLNGKNASRGTCFNSPVGIRWIGTMPANPGRPKWK